MNKTATILFVSMTTVTACAQQQPAYNPQATGGTNASYSQTQGYPANSAGATESMPSSGPTSTTSTSVPGGPATGGGAAPDESSPSSNAAQPSSQAITSWSDGQILQIIHSADEAEIEQAALASTRATNSRVKRFAAMMIADHTNADDEAKSVAKRAGESFESSPACQDLEADARANTDNLIGQSGADFDRAYMQMQVKEHQSLLATIDDDLIPHAQSTDVKNMLTKVRATVVKHLQHARQIYATLKRDSFGR